MNYTGKHYGENYLLSMILLLSLILTSCKKGKEDSAPESPGTPVNITHPVIKDMTDYIQLNGATVFLNKEIIRSTFQGFIEKVYKNIGDNIKPGDVLFQIKTKELAANDTIKIDIGSAVFRVSVLIKAKSNGILTEINYHSGDFVSDGEQLAIVSNPASLMVNLSVPFEEVSNIRLGANCEVVITANEKANATIVKRIPAVDPGTQTQSYLIKLKYNRELPESLTVIVKIPLKVYKDAVVLSKSAINTNVNEDSFWIMKLVNDSTAVKVNIKKGIENDSLIQILDPKLNTLDRIISSGAYGLPDTATIEIIK
jgi:biotin carboxyl carrier protein